MSIFNPAFELRVQARRARERQAEAFERAILPAPPPLDDDGEPVRLVFTGEDARALRRVAHARRENVAVLARAIVARALRDGSAEDMLGEERAEEIAGGHGRRPVAGESLTKLQCAVLYLIGEHGGATRWCGWSAAALARLMPGDVCGKQVAGVVLTLERRELLMRTAQLGNAPRLMRLTDIGLAVYRELAGMDDG